MYDPTRPDRDSLGNPIRPGDRVIFDALGRPLRVHPSRICRACGAIRESEVTCQDCGAVRCRPAISSTLTAGLLIAGAFAARDYFVPSAWVTVGFWVGVVLAGFWVLEALRLWHQTLKGTGIRVGGLIGAALLFGGLGWLVDWWSVGRLDTWAVIGAAGGAAVELIAGQYYFWRDQQ
jgi:hypothetical protein